LASASAIRLSATSILPCNHRHPCSGQPVQVTVDITNTGDLDGDGAAQLYFRENASSVETPERSLAGFSRIRLRPQKTNTVTFKITQSQLAVWNAEGKWVVEPGQYTVWAGGSSQASLAAQFRLQR
jgi:beta-glucosidase